MTEPIWNDGCQARGVPPAEQCEDCKVQRRIYGYTLVDGAWVKS